jgi:hypothetical protein
LPEDGGAGAVLFDSTSAAAPPHTGTKLGPTGRRWFAGSHCIESLKDEGVQQDRKIIEQVIKSEIRGTCLKGHHFETFRVEIQALDWKRTLKLSYSNRAERTHPVEIRRLHGGLRGQRSGRVAVPDRIEVVDLTDGAGSHELLFRSM